MSSVFISCIDTRVLSSNIVRPNAGETFFSQNPGNMLSPFEKTVSGKFSGEGAALEIGCVLNGIRNVVICGHSDCKVCN